MKKLIIIPALILLVLTQGCTGNTEQEATVTSVENTTPGAGQSAVQDNESAKDVVKVAAGSKDHTTLVAALKQAGLVDALSNAGPFTVFAPVNSAFDKLPPGTVDDLMKAENKEKLIDILQYHVYVGRITTDMINDGQVLNQVNGGNITISKKDGKIIANNANVITSIPASNGIIHVIDGVLTPPAK